MFYELGYTCISTNLGLYVYLNLLIILLTKMVFTWYELGVRTFFFFFVKVA
jgi:hypothetical protein